MEHLDHSYQLLMIAQCKGRGHQYHERVMAGTFCDVLDDSCPWVEIDIGNGVTARCLELPSCAVQDINLSSPATIAFWHM
jgi:hypothetical protein